MEMQLEGHPSLSGVTPQQVSRGVDALASPIGPTFIIVEDGEGSYCQAAGTDGRYVLEARESFGEGFLHYRAYRGTPGGGEPAKVFYRKRCDKHPPRRCPLTVLSSEVIGLDDVRRALVAFTETGERCPETAWRDVSAEFPSREPTDSDEVQVIQPTATRECRAG
jgi:hypothetical protein